MNDYEIDNGDMTIKLTITYDERMDSVTRVKCLNYDIVKKEDKRSYFYNYSERFRLPTNNVECEPHIDDEATIMLDSLDGAYVSQNDISLLAYIISWVDVMPETVPFLYIDNIRIYYSNYEPEYQKELQHDVILLQRKTSVLICEPQIG